MGESGWGQQMGKKGFSNILKFSMRAGDPTYIAHEWCIELVSGGQLSGVNLQAYYSPTMTSSSLGLGLVISCISPPAPKK
jgi:hypothetical protein